MVTACRRTIVIKVFVIINTIVVNIQIHNIGNTVIIVVINVCQIVTITDFFIIVDSVAIIVIVFNISDTVIVMVKW